MTNAEFRTTLTEAFDSHMFMNIRDEHTINELLYILQYDKAFKGSDFNISIIKKDGGCLCIPTLDAFVNTATRGMWFADEKVEFEVEEFGEEKFNCITIYESEEN